MSTKSKKHLQLGILLIDLQAALASAHLWSSTRPSNQALESQQPFCIDTLNFTEWLQFIFIERMEHSVKNNETLPEECNIVPMAEEYFKRHPSESQDIIKTLQQIDALFSYTNTDLKLTDTDQRIN